MKTTLLLLLTWTAAAAFGAGAPFYNVKDFGAAGDGKKFDTRAIQKTIDACAAKGGGKVILPAGTYLTGALFLKSHIHLELEAGATLLGSTNFNDYPLVHGRWEGIERQMHSSLLTGYNLENVSITGRGTLDGRGAIWWEANSRAGELRRQRGISGREPENPADSPMRWPRARMIYLQSCTNILIRDVTLTNSPSWNIHPVYCEHMTIDNVTILAPANSHNTDAIDPDSCRDLRISNSYFSVGDDDIVIKSGYNEDGRRVGIPCENIVINNCTFGAGHGAIVIGSEASGSVRNVTVANCVCDGTDRGIRVKTALGRGGVIEDFRVSNFVMRNILKAALSITSNYGDSQGGPLTNNIAPETIPAMRRFDWTDITIVSASRVAEFNGLRESPLQDVSIRNLRVAACQAAIHAEYAQNLLLENIDLPATAGPAFEGHDLNGLEINRLTVPRATPEKPVISLRQAGNVLLRDCRVPAGAGTLLRATDSDPSTLHCEANRLGAQVKERD
jgi:polygalacturonase